MIKLKVWGGAGEHGRSAYLLRGSRVQLLLDCGVKKEGAGEYPLIEPEIVKELDVVLLSHAHEDHSVAIPLLYRLGYQGEVWTTRETREQLDTYFRAWRRNMERAGHALPYEEGDEQLIRYRFLEDEAEGGTWFEMVPGVSVVWGRSGHLAGSVWFGLEIEDKRIFYSGDYTSESMLLQEDCPADTLWQARLPRNRRGFDTPVSQRWKTDIRTAVNGGHVLAGQPSASQTLPFAASEGDLRSHVSAGRTVEQGNAYAVSKGVEVNKASSSGLLDLVIMDAAYGTDCDTQANKLEQLEQAIHETIARSGKVLLPMPSVGRGQEIMLWAQQQFPDIPIVVEQGLVDGLKQLLRAPYWLKEEEEHIPGSVKEAIGRFLRSHGWEMPVTKEERERLLHQHAASLWFIPDGMMQSSLARWYYSQFADDENNLVLLTGHVSAGTYAYSVLQNPANHGACEVRKIRYKVHQGWKDVEKMLHQVPARHMVLVHADRAETDKLREGLLSEKSVSGKGILHSLSPGDELYL
ncbi:MBL fold metallo-hydrolase [Paenibacillus taichungensis]|uniref:MBL fold metallo-hydrolase n=1 Tax=Paenibacillus taichungensis TaxID=484184 RepID=UPI002871EA22|nr:MBL fold metallo-hydrolase [Paenibacillus taichungensis]MDR9748278.1 MBL fold metallo-hydrolase [Paenibacillus taichungensis]